MHVCIYMMYVYMYMHARVCVCACVSVLCLPAIVYIACDSCSHTKLCGCDVSNEVHCCKPLN